MILMEVSSWKHLLTSFLGLLTKQSQNQIPTPRSHRSHVWFFDECKEAILERKRSPTNANLQEYRIKRANARQVIRANKKNSCHEYVSKLNARTSMKKCWDMVRKIKGEGGRPSVKHIEKNVKRITQPRDIANTLGEAMSFKSSSAHYSPKFQRIKIRQERHPLTFQSDKNELYNQTLFNR